MTVYWGGRGREIFLLLRGGAGNDKGETKEVKSKEEEEALLNMLKRAAAMEEAVVKAIAEAEDRHRVNKESL